MSPTNHTTTITMWLNRSTHTAHTILIKIKIKIRIKSKLKDEFISKEKRIIIKITTTETTMLLQFVNHRTIMNTYKIPFANIYKKNHTIPVRVSVRMIPTTITNSRTPWPRPNEKSFTNITKRMINRSIDSAQNHFLFRIYPKSPIVSARSICVFHCYYTLILVCRAFYSADFQCYNLNQQTKQLNEYLMYCNNFSWKFS